MYPPAKSFTTIILGNIDPKHFIFAKDYKPEPKRCAEEVEMLYVDNEDGFWTVSSSLSSFARGSPATRELFNDSLVRSHYRDCRRRSP